MKPRAILDPVPGFYRVRMVRGGPFVGARIYRPCPVDPSHGDHLDRWPALCAEIDGESCSVDRVWLFGEPITAGEFEYLRARSRFASNHRPDLPEAEPRKPVDLLTAPLPF